MKFAKYVFWVAGIYGLAVIAPLYFLEESIGRLTPPAITHPEYFYGFVGAALAWQILFLVLATDPVRLRPMMLPAVVEKVTWELALVVLFVQHRLPVSVMAVGSFDWIFAALFVAAYLATRPRVAS
jgi:hypothetical protein